MRIGILTGGGDLPGLNSCIMARSTVLMARPASRRVELGQWVGRVAILIVLATAIVWPAAGCDTVRIKAAGNEKKIDWGVGVRF